MNGLATMLARKTLIAALVALCLLAAGVGQSAAAATSPDLSFGREGAARIASAHGKPAAIASGPNGEIVVVSLQYIAREQDHDSTTLWVSKFNSNGRPARSFGGSGTVRYRSRGNASGQKIAIGGNGSVTIVQIVDRRAGYAEEFPELQLVRFTKTGQPDSRIGRGGKRQVVRSRTWTDRSFDEEWVSLAVDAHDTAYVLAWEGEPAPRIHAIDRNGKRRSEFTDHTKRLFKDLKSRSDVLMRISEITASGELLVTGLVEREPKVEIVHNAFTYSTLSVALLIDERGDLVQSFGQAGKLWFPTSSWVHNEIASLRLTSGGVAAIMNEDRPSGSKDADHAWDEIHRLRLRILDRAGVQQPLPSADAEGGMLFPRATDLSDSAVIATAVGGDGSGAILRRARKQSRFQLTTTSPGGSLLEGAAFQTKLDAKRGFTALLVPETRSVWIVGAKKGSQGLTMLKFRAP